MKFVRYTIVLAAIATLLLPSLYSNVLQLNRSVAKWIAAEKLEAEQLKTYRILQSEFHWNEEGKELLYKNQLYDVQSFYFIDSTLIFTGILDEEETVIEQQLTNLLNDPSAEEKLKTIALNIFNFMAFLPPLIDCENCQQESSLSIHLTYRNFLLPSLIKSVDIPPPDRISIS
jgi:hypothetical protein